MLSWLTRTAASLIECCAHNDDGNKHTAHKPPTSSCHVLVDLCWLQAEALRVTVVVRLLLLLVYVRLLLAVAVVLLLLLVNLHVV